MINRLMHYKNLPNNEKIYYLQNSLTDFEQYYNQACAARQKITDFIEMTQAKAKEQMNNGGDVNHQKREGETKDQISQPGDDQKVLDSIQ